MRKEGKEFYQRINRDQFRREKEKHYCDYTSKIGGYPANLKCRNMIDRQ